MYKKSIETKYLLSVVFRDGTPIYSKYMQDEVDIIFMAWLVLIMIATIGLILVIVFVCKTLLSRSLGKNKRRHDLETHYDFNDSDVESCK